MDLVNAAVGLQQAKLMSSVQIAVARKILDSQQQEGSAATQLLDAATNGIDKAGDAMVAAATGLGGQIDVTG
jgi:Putative motility protein